MSTVAAGETGQANAALELSAFVLGCRYADLPDDVLAQARRCFVDCFGVALAARDDPSVGILLDTVGLVGGQPQARIWGFERRSSVLNAPLVNGHLAHLLDFDDSYVPEVTVLHGEAPIVPAALAIAETTHASGAEFVRAFALGFEVAARMALCGGRSLYEGHFHVTAVVGGVGAAVAAGVLLGLTERQMGYALGLATTQAGGIGSVLGSMSKAFHAGRAASNGVLSALLAARGFTSGDDGIAGRLAFHQVFPSDRDMDALLGDLGTRWEIRRAAFKAYACGVVLHPLIDGVIGLADEHGIQPDRVEAIECRANPTVLVATGKPAPTTGLEGKFSVYHTLAVALVDRAAGPAQYTDQRVADPAIVALRQRVRVEADPAVRKAEAFVTIRLKDGRALERHVQHASGTAQNPLSDAQIDRKFRSLAEPVLGSDGAGRLLDAVAHLADMPDAADLADLLVPASR